MAVLGHTKGRFEVRTMLPIRDLNLSNAILSEGATMERLPASIKHQEKMRIMNQNPKNNKREHKHDPKRFTYMVMHRM